MFFESEKTKNQQGILVIHQDLWWDVQNGGNNINWTASSVKFKGKHGNHIMIYGNIITLYYSNEKEKNDLIQSYQLVEKNKRQ